MFVRERRNEKEAGEGPFYKKKLTNKRSSKTEWLRIEIQGNDDPVNIDDNDDIMTLNDLPNESSVTSKKLKLPNVYKGCPKMISL